MPTFFAALRANAGFVVSMYWSWNQATAGAPKIWRGITGQPHSMLGARRIRLCRWRFMILPGSISIKCSTARIWCWCMSGTSRSWSRGSRRIEIPAAPISCCFTTRTTAW